MLPRPASVSSCGDLLDPRQRRPPRGDGLGPARGRRTTAPPAGTDGRPAPAVGRAADHADSGAQLAGHRRGRALPLRRERGDLHVGAHPVEGGVDERQRVGGADGAGTAQVRLLDGERRGGSSGGGGQALDRAAGRGDGGGDLGDLVEVRPAGRQHLRRARSAPGRRRRIDATERRAQRCGDGALVVTERAAQRRQLGIDAAQGGRRDGHRAVENRLRPWRRHAQRHGRGDDLRSAGRTTRGTR